MKEYNNKKICFIICADNQQYLDECLLYLSLIEVPEGYEIDLLTIEGAASMVSGYNEAMNASDSKYKIYIQQDTFVLDRKILYKIIDIFESDRKIGLLGVLGSESLSKDAVLWHGEICGNCYQIERWRKRFNTDIVDIEGAYKEVEAVEGILLATQYDIPWREDILKEWNYCDISQSYEFKRAGYKVVVPKQEEPWVNHCYRKTVVDRDDTARKMILEEYPEIWSGKEYLRVYFMLSKEIGILGIAYSLKRMGHSVVISDKSISIRTDDEKAVEKIEEELITGNYDLVMSYDFITSAAIACDKCKVKYWAWVYDSPLIELYTEEAKLSYAYTSVFDRKQYSRIKQLGVKNLCYLPLATEVDFFGMVDIRKSDEVKYSADIAFVGRLYDKKGYEELFSKEDEKLREEADEIVRSCNCVWDGKTTVYGKASDELIQYIASKENDEGWQRYNIDKRYFCESMKLVRKCNEIERVKILNALAEKYNVALYSNEGEKAQLAGVDVRPWVDYWKEMPKVFYLSKINLNITSRSIESGIPQRVWDIMAVGGFCLTNYQPELEEYFEIGKDLDVYHSLDELIEKVDYYLKHDESRIRIAMNGYKKVRAKHSYISRINEGLKWVLGEKVE